MILKTKAEVPKFVDLAQARRKVCSLSSEMTCSKYAPNCHCWEQTQMVSMCRAMLIVLSLRFFLS